MRLVLKLTVLAALALCVSIGVAAARTTLAGPQETSLPVGPASIGETYEIYEDNGRVFIAYHIAASSADFGLTATRTWDASSAGCINLINNAPVGPPRGAADHVLRVGACSSGLSDGKIRITLNHYVRAIIAPGTVSDQEEVSPIIPETEFSLGPGRTPPPPVGFTTLNDQSIYDGVIDVGNGYELRQVDCYYAGNNTHRFTFEAFGPRGRIRAFTYDGADATPWESRIGAIQLDGHTLYFAFSSWANQRAQFHYLWR
ncbi:MAG: hypothetical protein WAU68_09760 [Vitreimonas sp.]